MLYFIEGRIIPERTDVCINAPIHFCLDQEGVQSDLKISIFKSKIIISFQSNEFQFNEIKNKLQTIAGHIVNQIGFNNGCGYYVILDSILNYDSSEVYIFGADGFVFDASIKDERYTYQSIDRGRLNLELANDHNFNRAIFEISNAVRHHDFTAMHCQIAIESIRNAFMDSREMSQADMKKEEKNAWEKMRAELSVSKSSAMHMHEEATYQRHGRIRPQIWDQRQKCLQIAWEVVSRYKKYIENGRKKLNVPEL